MRSFIPLSALLLVLAATTAARADDDPKGELIKTIRVLDQNIYGRKENDCTERYKALAANILAASPRFDVVALNEHWRKMSIDKWFTCDDTVLTKALLLDADFAAKNHSVMHLPSTDDALESAGGLSVFSRFLMTDAYEAPVANGRPMPLSGYVQTRIQVAPGVEFDLWTVHLESGGDGCDNDCRWEQATDMGSVMESISGVPAEKGQKGVPVLVVGDFNTGGPMSVKEKPPYAGNAGYANVFTDALRKPRDIWLELNGGSDGVTYDCTGNAINAGTCKDRERIDYMLIPESKHIVHKSAEYYLVPVKISLVKWQTAKGVPISDHYGLDGTFEIRRKPVKAAKAAKSDKPKPAKADAGATVDVDAKAEHDAKAAPAKKIVDGIKDGKAGW